MHTHRCPVCRVLSFDLDEACEANHLVKCEECASS